MRFAFGIVARKSDTRSTNHVICEQISCLLLGDLFGLD